MVLDKEVPIIRAFSKILLVDIMIKSILMKLFQKLFYTVSGRLIEQIKLLIKHVRVECISCLRKHFFSESFESN